MNIIWNTTANEIASNSASICNERITMVITIGGINNVYQPFLFLTISITINTAQNSQVTIIQIHINGDSTKVPPPISIYFNI